MGWQWSISSEAQAARWPPQALASSRISLEMTSSFFCASPCTLPVPASPSTPPSAPLPTAIEMLVQARATTATSWRRSALMRPARCSSIRKRVRETWLDIADPWTMEEAVLWPKGRRPAGAAPRSAAVEAPLQAQQPAAARARLVEAAVALVDDHRAHVRAVEQVLHPREHAQRARAGGPAPRRFQVQQAVAGGGAGAGVVHHHAAGGLGLER